MRAARLDERGRLVIRLVHRLVHRLPHRHGHAPCRLRATPAADGWLALGANTAAHLQRLFDVLGVPADEWQPLLEGSPGPEAGGPSFARARDPQAFRSMLAARLAAQSATDLEQRLNAAGVPAARVRSLQEFTQEAVGTGMLQPVPVGEGDARAITPGLGWRTWR
jgi:crotonobetainyl-CoA:carnitine CoA-transferase CaiB-like acyl-CoA transferase